MVRSVFELCGEEGIRTLGTVARTHDFQSCTFDHSVTSPAAGLEVHEAGVDQEEDMAREALPFSCSSGESGIRTHGTLTGTPDFESGTFGRSVISPPRTMTAVHRTVNAGKTSKNQGFAGGYPSAR
jgi:hypothetical protein